MNINWIMNDRVDNMGKIVDSTNSIYLLLKQLTRIFYLV